MKLTKVIALSCYVATSFTVLANPGPVGVYNGDYQSRTFKRWENGSYTGTPTEWSTIAPGAIGWGLSAQTEITDRVQAQVANAPDDYAYPLTGVNGGGGLLIYFGTNECLTISKVYTFNNTSANKVQISLYKNDVAQELTVGGTRVTLWPVGQEGSSYSQSVDSQVCRTGIVDRVEWRIVKNVLDIKTDDDGSVTFTNSITDENVYGSSTGTNNWGVGGTPGSGITITNDPVTHTAYTNAALNFSGGDTTTARESTLRSGLSAIVAELKQLNTGMDQNTAATIQNGGGGGGGGETDMTGVINAVENFHGDNTNLLTGILGALSGTNTLAGGGTNSGGEHLGLVDSLDNGNEDILTSLGTAPSILTGGDSSALTIAFFGTSLNLDPAVRFPGIGEFFKAGIMAVVSIMLGRYLSTLYFETAKVYATSQTGGLPAFGPWGSLGAIIAAAVPIIIVTAWVALFTAMFSYGISELNNVNSTVAAWTLANGTALYLINYFFPVSFILSAAWTRIIAPFAATKLIIVTSSMQRFLLGK